MRDIEFMEIQAIGNRKAAAMLCARVLLAGVFIVSAFSRIVDWNGSVLFLISHGLGGFAQAACVVSLMFELLGGVSLLLGFKARAGAIALMIFLAGVSLTQCFFLLPIDERALQMSMFLKNMAIMGGLMMVAVFGAGPFSVDDSEERIETITAVQSTEQELMSTR